MEILIGLIAALSAVIVSVVNNIFMMLARKKDDISGRLLRVEEAGDMLNDKIDLNNRGTMTTLKFQLKDMHDNQFNKVSSPKSKWSYDIDRVFREAYVVYKDLGGNGIIDKIKDDMDIWRDENATESYKILKYNTSGDKNE